MGATVLGPQQDMNPDGRGDGGGKRCLHGEEKQRVASIEASPLAVPEERLWYPFIDPLGSPA